MKNSDWLNVIENLSLIGSIGGTVASVVSQQAAFAAIPLSLCATLNLANRKILLDSINQSNQTAIAQIRQEYITTQDTVKNLAEQLTELEQLTTKNDSKTEAKFGTLNEQQEQLQQIITGLEQSQDNHNLAIAQLAQENVTTQHEHKKITEQLMQLEEITTANLQQDIQHLLQKQKKIAKTIDNLREIQICTQSIRINANSANTYYERGLSFQALGDTEAALGDYSDAIRLNSSYAEAYHKRGLIRADLGDKKGAVEDLRAAAKFFFEAGDIDNYQIAKDFNRQFHELNLDSQNNSLRAVTVNSLFSA